MKTNRSMYHSLHVSGFVTLLAVSILFVLLLSLSLSATYFSIDEAQSSRTLIVGESVLALAEGCLEDALLKSMRDEMFDGGTISLSEGECDVVVSKESTQWTLRITGTREGFVRIIEARIDRAPGNPGVIVLRRWQEV